MLHTSQRPTPESADQAHFTPPLVLYQKWTHYTPFNSGITTASISDRIPVSDNGEQRKEQRPLESNNSLITQTNKTAQSDFTGDGKHGRNSGQGAKKAPVG